MTTKTKIVNVDTADYDVYIGRGTKWGNPFIIGQDGTRQEVLAAYKVHVLRSPELMASFGELYGKILGCHCKPFACHGDYLVEKATEWGREAYRCAAACDGFCDGQIVSVLTGEGKRIDELELTVIEMKDKYPCMFKSNVIGLGERICKTCGRPEKPHNFRHPFVPYDA